MRLFITFFIGAFLSACIMYKDFSYVEFVRSDTAKKNNIINVPNKQQIENGKALFINIIKPIRERFNDVRITSAFRSVELNAAVGGVPDSQHLNGEAVDIVVPDKEVVAQWIIDNLDFDQLIIEPTWLHISYKKNGNRKEVLNYK
jgi:hypothetical protein